jgi:hypothetical protein
MDAASAVGRSPRTNWKYFILCLVALIASSRLEVYQPPSSLYIPIPEFYPIAGKKGYFPGFREQPRPHQSSAAGTLLGVSALPSVICAESGDIVSLSMYSYDRQFRR